MNETTPISGLSSVFYYKDFFNKKKLFEKLSELLSGEEGPTFLRVLDGLTSREKLGSTYIGNGVAIPHCKLAIESPKVVIIVLGEQLNYSDDNKQQVDIVFALLVPSENCDQHIHLLSSIARLCEQESWLKGLRALESAQEIAKYITDTNASIGTLL